MGERPAISLQSADFYTFVLLLCAVYCGCAIFTSGFQGQGAKNYVTFLKKQCAIPLLAAVLLLAPVESVPENPMVALLSLPPGPAAGGRNQPQRLPAG